AAIVTAILIGDRAGLSDAVERRLQEAGTFHVIAISGGNVALLTAMCFAAARMCFRSPRTVSFVTIVAVAAYCWIVGADASVARAVAAAILYLALGMAGLRPPPVTVLRVAAIAMVAADPLTVLDIGAWLSFAATLGIVSYGSRWMTRVFGPPARGIGHGIVRVIGGLIVATIAAETVLLPVTVAAFSRVSLAGVVLNLVAIPAMAVVQIAGFAVVSLAGIWPPLASGAATIATLAARGLLSSCALVDFCPWLSWRVPPAGPGWVAGYYVGLLCVAAATSHRLRTIATAICALCLIVIVTAPFLPAAQPAAGRLRITMVDVGQGEALLLQAPGGHALLVDTGGTPGPFDIGGRVVTPAVWALGVRRLDWLALSHGDRDHVGGASSVLRDLNPGEIWEGVPVPRDPDRAELVALTEQLRVPWRTVLAGARLTLGPVVVESTHPPAPEWERQRVRNDDSIVLRVTYGAVDFWLTGDAGTEFERTMLHGDPEPRLRVLKVGHHGSRTATASLLVDALRPQIALISAGRGNLFGHPSPDVVSRLERAGARIFRTDLDGAIAVETDGVSVRVSTVSGKVWSAALAGVVGGPP
ncbi:MAG TPA: DNA internalization-related competence protein ComEC/Rec2, partial [Vicinamibacterales bacterium]|nr:DNA internalization-related competence protein ComEC/Rec2 [Vicinamibacterales bacterium]